MAENRTSKSLRNSAVALLFYFITLVVEFFSRKIFLDHLGEDILGLNTTAQSLLQFLNIAELGIGVAIAFALYKPLANKDHRSICEIVSLQGHFYKIVAWVVIFGAVAIMCFFPAIFGKMTLPLWYAYASFSVMLVSALLSYFFNYKQVVLAADQKNYKIQYSFKGVMIVKVICQMIAVKWFPYGYEWWLALELAFAIIATITLTRTVRKTYPYLKSVKVTKELKKRYSEIYLKIKQLTYGKIATFALSQTSPLIIYAYIDLAVVALYGNYMLVSNGVTALVRAAFNDMAGGIGNLVASSELQHILKVFKELFCVRFMICCVLCFGVYVMTTPFIQLWIGDKYVLDNTFLILMVFFLLIQTSRTIVESFTQAYGLFGDVLAPVIEAILNIGLSILLGYYYGLNGIMTGVLISLVVIVVLWKPYYLYTRGFRISVGHYLAIFFRNALQVAIATLVTLLAFSYIVPEGLSPIAALIIAFAETIVFALLLNTSLYLTHSGIDAFIFRLKKLLK